MRAVTPLKQHEHGPALPRDDRTVMAQVGWLGASGAVYALDDQPLDGREAGSFTPLYLGLGVWEDLGDGRWGIKD